MATSCALVRMSVRECFYRMDGKVTLTRINCGLIIYQRGVLTRG
jgi:hypothetical protein